MRPSLLAVSVAVGVSLACACYGPGRPVLEPRDTVPPTVLATAPDAGGTIKPGTPLTVTFSEPLEPGTVEAGISVQVSGNPVAVVLTLPPPALPQPYDADGGTPYVVGVAPASGAWPPAAELVLTPELTDLVGLALPDEVRVPFTAEP